MSQQYYYKHFTLHTHTNLCFKFSYRMEQNQFCYKNLTLGANLVVQHVNHPLGHWNPTL